MPEKKHSEEKSLTASELMQLARLKRQQENQEHVIGLKKEINSDNFFISDKNPKGFMHPKDLISDIASLPPSYDKDFRAFFDSISKNEKLERRNSNMFEVRNTKLMAFEVVRGPYNFRESFRIVLIKGMEDVLKAVKTNSFIFNLDYDDLVVKAYNLTSID